MIARTVPQDRAETLTTGAPIAAPGTTVWPLALLLVAVLTLGRSWTEWSDLSALRLPDTDDLMRLVQIRDWIGGQPFSDLTQHRMGPATSGGTAMHWSRLADIGPAALLALGSPLVGGAAAERVAVILWPALLLLGFLLLSASIAVRLANDPRVAPVAAVLAALAWPATSLFVPGRIDHHGLQIVLLLAACRGLLFGKSWHSHLAAGLAIAASLNVGVELVVQIALVCAVAQWRWMYHGDAERGRILALAGGIAAGVCAGIAAAPDRFAWSACDGFTRQAAHAALLGAAALAFPVLFVRTDRRRARVIACCVAACAAAGAILLVAPTCLANPYAALDPVVRIFWLARVEEAQSAAALPPGQFLATMGLPLFACAIGLATLQRAGKAARLTLVLLIGSATLLAFHQARAAQVAAALAPAILAPWVAAMRRREAVVALAAWIASIGISYQQASRLIFSRGEGRAIERCDTDAALRALAHRPSGLVLAPIDLAPRILATTPHRVVAGPYHRNADGIALTLRLAPADGGIDFKGARTAGIDYAIACNRTLMVLHDEP